MAWTKDLPAEGAQAYDNTFKGNIVGEYTDVSEQQPVIPLLRREKDALLLDAGCGNGRFLDNAADGQPFVAMDISLEMVKLARQRLGRGFFVVGEMERLPFKDGAIDQVVCSRVMQHIVDQPRAIREMARVCRSGGDVIVLALNAWTLHCLYKEYRMSRLARIVGAPLRWLLRKPYEPWPFTYDKYNSLPELARMFRRAGLCVTARRGGTVGMPWVFYLFSWGRKAQKYFYRPLTWYFPLCRRIEDRLMTVWPFTHLMDKVIIRGRRESARAAVPSSARLPVCSSGPAMPRISANPG